MCHAKTLELSSIQTKQTLQCTLDNSTAGKVIPAVIFDGAAAERTNHLRYHNGLHFDQMLMCGNNTEVHEGPFSVLKAMAENGI